MKDNTIKIVLIAFNPATHDIEKIYVCESLEDASEIYDEIKFKYVCNIVVQRFI